MQPVKVQPNVLVRLLPTQYATGVLQPCANKQRLDECSRMQSVSCEQVQTNALMSAAEVAKGTRYTEALTTSWRAPKYYRDMTEEGCDKLREKWSILVDVSCCCCFDALEQES